MGKRHGPRPRGSSSDRSARPLSGAHHGGGDGMGTRRLALRVAPLVAAALWLLACAPAGGGSPAAAPAQGAGAASPSAGAAPPTPERLPLGISTPSGTYAGVYAAMEAGLFERA